MLLALASLVPASGDSLRQILADYRKIQADYYPVDEASLVDRGLRVDRVVERFEAIGPDAELELWDFFADRRNEAELRQVALDVFRASDTGGLEGPMIAGIRRSLVRFFDSGFQDNGDFPIILITLLGEAGSEEDRLLLKKFEASENPMIAWTGGNATRTLERRLKDSVPRIDKGKSGGDVSKNVRDDRVEVFSELSRDADDQAIRGWGWRWVIFSILGGLVIWIAWGVFVRSVRSRGGG